MKNAWASARAGAKRFGGSSALYFREALRQEWARLQRIARESAEAEARVLAEIEKMRAEGAFRPTLRRDSLFVRTVPCGRGGGRSLGFRGW